MSKRIDDKDLEKISGGAVDFGPDQLDQTAGPDAKSTDPSGNSTGSGGGAGTDFNQDGGSIENP